MLSIRHRRYLVGTGILTSFPCLIKSVKLDLRTGLPPANDVLPGNPGPFGGGDSHPSLLLLPPGSALPEGPLNFTAQLLPYRNALLPDRSFKATPQGIGGQFSPVHF